ncbi:uncharacterized protein LOC9660911 [Selaginella moellendorffii]|uniref:uncharacterized protein LOC9660911 n=1 Tax=Selaginella moellendorffii TaxID=88036 RepID=UPI000D1C2C77|nr:uncharacterized protein LOC9660911 [Selaginella moellendorffii]|eukprot:XP_002982301.2 uncharacterized protein LOC9660911 [Selaginella moellendorffii]
MRSSCQSLHSPSISLPSKRRRLRRVATAALSNAQVKQAEMLIERLSTRLTTDKVLDKITTVIAGQTPVEPDILDKQLKAITTGEDYNSWEELRTEFVRNASNLWTSSYDLLTNFNPFELGHWVGGLIEDFAERFAAWELSSLVAIGERWVIWTPLVVLTMAWQMSKNRNQNGEATESQTLVPPVTEKQKQVRKEIERMKLRCSLLQEVGAIKGSATIQAIVKQLQMVGSMFDDETAMENINGSWQLLYASQEPAIFSRLPGLEISNLEQKFSRRSNDQTLTIHNLALLRLPGVGAVRVELKGVWNKSTGMVVFDEVSAGRAFESPVSWDLTRITLALPVPRSERWELLYMDDVIRVNQGDDSHLYIYSRLYT